MRDGRPRRRYAPLMRVIRDLYNQAAESADIAPDMELLSPVFAIFEKIEPSEPT